MNPCFPNKNVGLRERPSRVIAGRKKREYASILENASLCLSFFLSKRGVQRGSRGSKQIGKNDRV
jgi:hypothetical protein